MYGLMSLLNRFSDIVSKILNNKDKIRIKLYDVEQYEEIVTVVIMAKDKEAGTLIREIIETTLNRLYEMQEGGD